MMLFSAEYELLDANVLPGVMKRKSSVPGGFAEGRGAVRTRRRASLRLRARRWRRRRGEKRGARLVAGAPERDRKSVV